MGRTLLFNLGGMSFDMVPTKVERKKIYGYTEQRVTTPDGGLCRQACLDGNGMTLIPSGGVKLAMTNDKGEWVEKSELTAKFADGRDVVPVISSFDQIIELDTEAKEEDLLDHLISSVYQLSGESAAELAGNIATKIYTFPFSFRGGNKTDTAFLFAQDNSIFMLVGEKVNFEMIGLAEQAVLDDSEELAEDENDELDFSMF